jgi:hypothetical protein
MDLYRETNLEKWVTKIGQILKKNKNRVNFIF